MAALGGQLIAVKLLVDAFADVNTINNLKRTPLHFSVLNGSLPTVKYLITEVSYTLDYITRI